jgi:prepilin-type N-terminal cleavage/methylation domain-containing protein
MKKIGNHIARRRQIRRGFTLIEVMISVALVLLLMYGVSQVFKMSGDAVGANQAVSKIIRDHRAAAATLADDFRNCAQDSPLFLISSRIGYWGPAPAGQSTFASGFRNAQEQRDNRNDDPTFIDGATTATPFLKLGASDRVPRLDRLAFFARGLYRRQTTPDQQGPLASSGEAYIWVGHVKVQKNPPAVPPEVETQFGADRILGRMAIVLKDRSAMSSAEITAQKPFVADSGPGPTATTAALWPFGYDDKPFVDYSDLAPVTMDQFRFRVDTQYQASPINWYRPMEDNGSNSLRFWCNPAVSRPITPRMLSQTVPFFVGNCTQFIVEYAGDYLNQDPITGELKNGKQDLKFGPDQTKNDVAELLMKDTSVTPPETKIVYGQTDGQIDFWVDKTANATDPTKWVHRTRWYGLPRDVNGDGAVDINDVVPLADVLDYAQITVAGNPAQTPWEKDVPTPNLQTLKDYAKTSNTDATKFRYTCAWHNDAPPMIRILVKIDDPTGRLQDGQWYEYIFSR